MPIDCRRLVPADAERYVTLRRAMLLDAPASFGSSPGQDHGSDIDKVRDRLTPGMPHATFGAFDDTAGLVGAVGVGLSTRLKEKHKASIWGMYVAPDFRRRGIARRLMEEAIAFSKAADGVAQVQLSVSASAPGAQRLYASLGFTVWGTEPDALRIDGRSYNEHHMSLRLT